MRIASDAIRLPGGRTGHYACTKAGLALVVGDSALASGDLVVLAEKIDAESLPRDKKSGAFIINLKSGGKR